MSDGGLGEVVNLRMARKRAKRRDAEARADENRIRHGRTAAERRNEALHAERAERLLEGARRDPDAPGGPDGTGNG